MNPGAGTDAGQPPAIRLPEPRSLFTHRARRLRELAALTPGLSGYLSLLATLAERQAALSAERDADLMRHDGAGGAVARERGAGPDGVSTEASGEPSASPRPLADGQAGQDFPPWQPPLSLQDEVWALSLPPLLQRLAAALPPVTPDVGETSRRLIGATPDAVGRWLAGLVSGECRSGDAAVLPFVATGLQVLLAQRASRLAPVAAGRPAASPVCPVCGGWPVASVLRAWGEASGLRYLHCGLCASEWLFPRIQCAHCGSQKAMAFVEIEGGGGVVKAATCGDCRAYLKQVDRSRLPGADAIADDLATLALDVLLAEQGFARSGFNPCLFPGE